MPATGHNTERPDHVSRRSSSPAISPSGSRPRLCETSRKLRPITSAAGTPTAAANSSEIALKRPSASVFQTKRTGAAERSTAIRGCGFGRLPARSASAIAFAATPPSPASLGCRLGAASSAVGDRSVIGRPRLPVCAHAGSSRSRWHRLQLAFRGCAGCRFVRRVPSTAVRQHTSRRDGPARRRFGSRLIQRGSLRFARVSGTGSLRRHPRLSHPPRSPAHRRRAVRHGFGRDRRSGCGCSCAGAGSSAACSACSGSTSSITTSRCVAGSSVRRTKPAGSVAAAAAIIRLTRRSPRASATSAASVSAVDPEPLEAGGGRDDAALGIDDRRVLAGLVEPGDGARRRVGRAAPCRGRAGTASRIASSPSGKRDLAGDEGDGTAGHAAGQPHGDRAILADPRIARRRHDLPLGGKARSAAPRR